MSALLIGETLNQINSKSNQIKCWFLRRGENREPGEKPLGAEYRTNKLSPLMTPSAGIEPRTHWWKTSPLATTPALLPIANMSQLKR